MAEDILNARRLALAQLLKDLDAADRAAEGGADIVELDQQAVGRLSRMDALQRQQMAKETQRRRQQERRKIVAALIRIDEGEYGWCGRCGDKIDERRLDVDLTAHLCISCAG